ncbi:phosphate/phosphite/phosphonate ABC transporter substrate-binding protein [Streptomyces avicenniae]|uniref:phosphate/phosphite/phosphonate ABC transporter substrate-binding protein n=1 Tax=Streptomyces avicenniae TaxID=500153 RepID=UPI00069B3675|nr:phosphate/phosphite/phosphonate ABC transporter substrate-binding protein [Streptomyces avicenniae]
MRPTRPLPSALALATAAGLLLTACGGGDGAADDTAEGSASASCPGGEIRFGVEPYEDPAALRPAYEVLARALQERLDCPVTLQIVDDYSAEVLAMQNGELELAQFGPLGYVFASERADAVPVASFADGSGELTTYTAGIWVPADSPVTSVEDLPGHSLALGGVGSTSGDALPRYALEEAGVSEDDVEIDYAGGHPEALLALVNGRVDAAQINSQQLATAEAEGTFDPADFRQIWTSDPIPNDPITVAGALGTEFEDAVRDALLDLAPEDVAEIGSFLDVDPPGPLIAVERSTYQPLFDLAASLGLTEEDV